MTPISTLHERQNTEELRKRVIAVQKLSSRFSEFFDIADEWKWDLQVAVKGIIQERKHGKKPKPELVVEDDLCY